MSEVNNTFSALIQFEHHLRKSETLAELGFVVTNELRSLIEYDQATLFEGSNDTRLKVLTLSDHASVDSTAPYINWLESILVKKEVFISADKPVVIDKSAWSKEEQKESQDFFLAELIWVPLFMPSGSPSSLGGILLSRRHVFTQRDIDLLSHISKTAAHAIKCIHSSGLSQGFLKTIRRKRFWPYVLIAVFVLSFVPVQLSVIAPAEVVSKEPIQVTSQLQGAVKRIDVIPGQAVSENDLLVLFEDTELLSRYAVSKKALLKAKAELLTAQRGGFLSSSEKSRVAELEANVALKQTEMLYAKNILNKTQLNAVSSGIVIMNDPKEWEGRPVQVGEKILSIAKPDAFELEILLPVKDFILLNNETSIRLFLDSDPLNSLHVNLKYITHMPKVSAEGILAYKVVAQFQDEGQALESVRIGMRGTAKLYGESVTLFYYLFRRPITTVRQWLGW